MKLVYLDQNHWIDLARAATGTTTPRGNPSLLSFLDGVRIDGRACFPLSLAHYIETQKQRDPTRRQRLANYMLALSEGRTLAPPHVVLRHEIEIAIAPYFPGRVSPRPLQFLGSGLTHAADHDFDFQLDWPNEAAAIPRAMRLAIEAKFLALARSALLSGVAPGLAAEAPLTDLRPERRFMDGLDKWRGAAARNSERDLNRRIYSITLDDILSDIWTVLEMHGIGQGEFAALGETAWCAILEAMPSRRADMQLRREWAKDGSLKPKESDLNDWAYLGVAVMYCDIVVTERQIASLFSRRFAPKARVITDVSQLLEVIRDAADERRSSHMTPTAKFKSDLLLAAGWRISRVRTSLRTKDRDGLIEFIRQRHRERFFDPIQQLRNAEKGQQGYGFAIMALCSLLIETIQSYRDGLPTTDRRELDRLRKLKVPAEYAIPAGLQVNGTKAFRRFFSRFRNEFDGISGLKFYRNIRCGLLHQAQTKRGWTIALHKPSLHEDKVLNRNRFASRLDVAFEIYLAELGNRQWDTIVWRNARRKIWWLIRLSW